MGLQSLVNRGFDTGAFTPWTYSGCNLYSTNYFFHTPSCRFPAQNNWVKQVLSPFIKLERINGFSLVLWGKKIDAGNYTRALITVETSTNGTLIDNEFSTEINVAYYGMGNSGWDFHSLYTWIKTLGVTYIASIKVTRLDSIVNPMLIDDVSLTWMAEDDYPVEQIANGGFEVAGTLVGWTYYNAWQFGFGHSGDEGAEMSETGWIEQTLSAPCRVSLISAFTLWLYAEDSAGIDTKVTVTYTDLTTSEFTFHALYNVWTQFNFLPYLIAGKTVLKIRIANVGGFPCYLGVDDVSLKYLGAIEKVINGGFETDDFTGWTEGHGTWWGEIGNYIPPYHDAGNCVMNIYQDQWVENTLPIAVPVANIHKFFVWLMSFNSTGANIGIRITYSDDTYTQWTFFTGTNVDWHYIDLLSYCEAGKSVSKIKFTGLGGTLNVDIGIDELSLQDQLPATADGTITTPLANLKLWNVMKVVMGQDCDVAIRPVPRRQEGEVLDTGTYILTTMDLQIVARLSDAERTTLEAMFDEEAECTVELGDGWEFIGWFRSKEIDFQWAVTKDEESGGNINRNWRVTMRFDIRAVSYSPT